ncbi:MAG: hypothetical protein ACLFUP_08215, partial [Desulfobacteraceae bacterium]
MKGSDLPVNWAEDEAMGGSLPDPMVYEEIKESLESLHGTAQENLKWLFANMHPYFFITMK